MSQYRAGTVNVTNGNAVVTGVGTLWKTTSTDIRLGSGTSGPPVAVGDLFSITGSLTVYEVLSVQSDTQLTLKETYKGSTQTNLRYSISRDFTPNNALPYMTPGDDVAGILALLIRKLDGIIAPGSTTVPKGTQGDRGESQYIQIAYASDAVGSDFSIDPNAASRYLGIRVSNSAVPSMDWEQYKWALFVGNATINTGPQTTPTDDNMLWPDGDSMQWPDGDNLRWG